MAWETRGSKEYLYHTYRDGEGKVRRRYLGAGALAEAHVAQAQQRSAEGREAKSQLAALQQAQAATDARADELDTAVRDLMAAELLAAGFHLHAGSEWRYRRDDK